MTLVLLHDQYGGRGIAGDFFWNLAEENLLKDRLPRRPDGLLRGWARNRFLKWSTVKGGIGGQIWLE